jgi:hypothetical protein
VLHSRENQCKAMKVGAGVHLHFRECCFDGVVTLNAALDDVTAVPCNGLSGRLRSGWIQECHCFGYYALKAGR